MKKGFTLIELIVVVTILGIIVMMTYFSFKNETDKAYETRSLSEMKALFYAMSLYVADHNNTYPCDANRDLPPGIEDYLSSAPNWPKAPWPGAVYDWDYWTPFPDLSGCKNPEEYPSCQPSGYCGGSLSYSPNLDIVLQFSIRFCDASGNNCHYPNEAWAQDFDRYSSAYWCVYGPCRAHGGRPYNHPGCCMGGLCPDDQPKCLIR